MGRPQVAALTATATPRVREDILKHLGLDDPVDVYKRQGDDKYFGKVGQELTVEEGQAAARAAILNRLAVIVQAVGSLERCV